MVSILANLIPFAGVWYYLFCVYTPDENSGRGAMSFGKYRAKLLTRDKNKSPLRRWRV